MQSNTHRCCWSVHHLDRADRDFEACSRTLLVELFLEEEAFATTTLFSDCFDFKTDADAIFFAHRVRALLSL